MRIGVLGPLRAETAGRPVELGGRMPRRLLAALVAHAGEVVPVAVLVDAMWGQEPPPSAVKTLQSYVARLRVALAGDRATGRVGGSDVIVTAGPGYRLMVSPELIDAEVFAADVRAARRAVDRGEPGAADRLLSEAFALWRGPPYGEFADTDFGAAEAHRLEEIRLTALEVRLDAFLASGRDAEVVADAEALCAAYPLRERFWAQLMIALYRCGRQADALAAFRRVRDALANEVGADPGPALRLLEQQVLRQDPVLDAPRPAPADAAEAPAPEPDADRSEASEVASEVLAERRVATVLVAAIGPSADRSDWNDPEGAEAVLHRFRGVCADVVAEAGGVISNHAETDVVAAFGVLPTYDDHLARALHAALILRERCHRSFGVLSAGIAIGELLRRAGPLGPTVTGEPVRTAAALRHAARDGEILVGERALSTARHLFEFTPLVDRTIGGGPPLRCAALTARRPQPHPRTIAGLGRTFVGRGDELDALEATFRRVVQQGRPHLTTVIGEAGVGKSTLVERFTARLDAGIPAPVVHVGRCLAYGQGNTYGPFAEILRAHLGFDADTAANQVLASLSGRKILGLTLGLDTAGDLDPRDARERLHTAWVALAEEMTGPAPAVFVLEDLHWAQQPLLDLVADLVTDVAGPLLLVATARPEYAEARPAALGPRQRQQFLWLEPLPDGQAETMLTTLLGETPTDALRRSTLVPAEGNPFFIEELLAALVDRGLLIPSGARWRLAADSDDLPVPDTVRSALAARIDCLSDTARATLQAAAVAGRVFAAAAVDRLVGHARSDLGELVVRDFIRRQRPGPMAAQPSYSFKHALTRQVAYDLLPAGRRARLHAGFADLLAEGGNLDERAPLLAHHYFEAARPDLAEVAWADDRETLDRVREQAVSWLWRAGELATRRFAVDEGLTLLHRAVDLAPPAPTQAELWRAIAEAYETRLDETGFLTALQHSIDVYDDPQSHAEAYSRMPAAVTDWQVLMTALPSDETVEGWIERALALAEPGTAAHTRALITRAGWFPEHFPALARQTLAAAEHSDDIHNLCNAYALQGTLARRERRFSDALQWRRKLVALVESDDPYLVGESYTQPITALMALGRFAAAREYAARYEAIAARQGRVDQLHAVTWWIEIDAMAREWSRVPEFEERIRRAVRDEVGRRRIGTVRALLLCAVARVHLGDNRAASSLVRLADELAGGHDDRLAAPYVRLALARRDMDQVAALMAVAPRDLKIWATWWLLDLEVTRLDALVALDDKEGVEAEAIPHLGTGDFIDAIARRALGAVRRDHDLLRDAAQAFARMNLPAHAALTRQLGGGPPRSSAW